MMNRCLLAVVAWLVLIPAAVSAAQPDQSPVFEPGDCPVQFMGDGEVMCGTVEVPQDREHAEERTVSLAVAVFKARRASPAPDPLIYLDGGPGARTLDSYAGGLNSLLRLINYERDVVAFDYRGMGYTEPALTCPESLDAEADDFSWVTTCRERYEAQGVDVTDYTTRDNAADAADIMHALGYETYNIWGGSYGSSVALTLLRDHPENIRAAIITAVQPPQGDLQASIPLNIQRVLDEVSALCEADEYCAAVLPGDLSEALATIVERLDAKPIPVATDTVTGELSGIDVLAAVAELLKDETNIPIVPGLIATLYAEQYDMMLPYANALAAPRDPGYPFGAWLSMRCTDSILATTPEAINTALERVPASIRATFMTEHLREVAVCQTWGARQPTETDRLPAITDIPVLMMSGALDPFSSQEWLDSALETLSNGQGFMLPYHAHFVIHNPCASRLLTGFIDDPSEVLDAGCLAQVTPPIFKLE